MRGWRRFLKLLSDPPPLPRKRLQFHPTAHLHRHRAPMIAEMVQDEEILIVRVLHGRQDWQRYLPWKPAIILP